MCSLVAYDVHVAIDPDVVRRARIRKGFRSQAALAKALGVSERTAWKFENEGVDEDYEDLVRDLLFPERVPTLAQFSDFELLIELGRRLDRVTMREAEIMARERLSHPDERHASDTPTSLQETLGSGTNAPGGPGRRQAPGQGFASEPTQRSRRRDDDARTEDEDI